MACQKNALKRLDANKALLWPDLKISFARTFGKSKIDNDIAGETGKMFVSEDPLSYVYHQLSYLSSTNPGATEGDKVSRLFDGLPAYLKGNFIENPPQTVQAFTDRLKDVQRKQAYNQKALIENTVGMSVYLQINQHQLATNIGGLGNFNSLGHPTGATQQSLMNTLAYLTANQNQIIPYNLISNLAAMNFNQNPPQLGLSTKPAVVQSYANLPQTSLADHVTQIVKEAN